MKTPSRDDLMEATRLTRAGRLGEATALLQRTLRGDAPPPEPGAGHQEHRTAGLGGALKGALGDLLARLRRSPAGPELRPEREPEPEPERRDAGGRWLAASFAAGGDSRDYRLYVPSGYRGQPVPLVVMLHGCTQSPEDFAAGTRMNEAAEARTLLVAYPEQPARANGSRCWNWFKPGDQGRDRGEPRLIAGIAREVIRGYAVDPRRVYVAGLSAGGAAAALVAAAYPDLFAAVGVHSGLPCGAARDVPSAFAAMRNGSAAVGRLPVPTIVFHGDGDTTVSPRNADRVLAQALAAAGPGLREEEETGRVPGGHAFRRTRFVDGRGHPVVEAWRVEGSGHAWSGGSAAGSFTDPQGPDATAVMLDFFRAHQVAAVFAEAGGA